jgi:hypothetical protein
MFPYWCLFGLWLVGTFNFTRSSQSAYSRQAFVAAAVITALMVGLRYEVGGDWAPYLAIYNNIYFQQLIPALSLSDPGYALLNWLGAQVDTGIWFVNLVCAGLFVAGVGRLASRQPQPWLAMLIAVPYFIIVVGMGYTRQAAAIGIVCFAVADGSDRNIMRTVILIGIAALFHKTALLMLPLVLGPIALRRVFTTLIGVAVFGILFVLLLRDQSSQLINSYAQSNYDSQGAGIRIAMNVLAAALFLILRKRMDFTAYQRSFWTLNALLTFLSVVALLSLSSSSGVDRISLFLIPLQMVALSRLPQALSKSQKPVLSALLGVIAYCFAVQFVWLNFADNAVSWVPYNAVILHS